MVAAGYLEILGAANIVEDAPIVIKEAPHLSEAELVEKDNRKVVANKSEAADVGDSIVFDDSDKDDINLNEINIGEKDYADNFNYLKSLFISNR
jgi:hypothetical protein